MLQNSSPDGRGEERLGAHVPGLVHRLCVHVVRLLQGSPKTGQRACSAHARPPASPQVPRGRQGPASGAAPGGGPHVVAAQGGAAGLEAAGQGGRLDRGRPPQGRRREGHDAPPAGGQPEAWQRGQPEAWVRGRPGCGGRRGASGEVGSPPPPPPGPRGAPQPVLLLVAIVANVAIFN